MFDFRQKISTHAPLARCDHLLALQHKRYLQISTHAPLARCDRSRRKQACCPEISTHAPLARCDTPDHIGFAYEIISTHAPLARCDRNILYILAVSSPMLEVGQNFLSKFLYIYIIKTPFPRRTYGLFSITYPSPIYFCNTNASANK